MESIPDKQKEMSNQIEKDTQAFISKGGEVEKVPVVAKVEDINLERLRKHLKNVRI